MSSTVLNFLPQLSRRTAVVVICLPTHCRIALFIATRNFFRWYA